jgi:nitroreductase
MPQTIIDSLKWRYATQVFDTSKQISEADLHTILEAGNLAATAFGLQPFEFIVVKDQVTKDSLVAHAYGQEHIAKNSALVVLAIRTDIDEAYINEYIGRIARIRNVPAQMLDGFKQSMLGSMTMRGQDGRNAWAQKQAYIALGTMMAAASELHIDNHGAEGFDPEKFDEILGLKTKNLHATVLLMLGYRTSTPDQKEKMFQIKVRKEYNDIVSVI